MKYELLAFSAISGDAFIKQNDDTYFISYPYEEEDLVLITDNGTIANQNILNKKYNQVFDSLVKLGNFLGKLYIDDIKNNPKFVQNKILLEKIEKEPRIAISTNLDFSIVLIGTSHQKHSTSYPKRKVRRKRIQQRHHTLSTIYRVKPVYLKANY